MSEMALCPVGMYVGTAGPGVGGCTAEPMDVIYRQEIGVSTTF